MLKNKNYFSYASRSGTIRNITKNIPTVWTIYDADLPFEFVYLDAYSGWLDGDSTILLHDQNDIWQVDLAANHPAVNLTNGYGRIHNIVFRLLDQSPNTSIANNETLILSAFNRTTKDNGFYRITLGKRGNPELLSMGPYVYNIPDNNPGFPGEPPIKAKNAGVFLVKRMSTTESPNWFSTIDFKTFQPLSSIHPEKMYNWLTTELVNWKTLDGSLSQGILYKPENFDPGKKYPIIFYYYQRLSDILNLYLKPESSMGPLDIPTYVSNGYLVFTPDIHYKIGNPGESAYNSVVSAANYFSKIRWVNSNKMGLQGHSYGAIETNYLITHSHQFAAACSASGVADFISGYGSLTGGGNSQQDMYENSPTENWSYSLGKARFIY